MKIGLRALAAMVAASALAGSIMVARVGAQGQGQVPSPRPGLTAQQTKQAVELAKGTMRELRKKTEGAVEPDADPREYVVQVEYLPRKHDDQGARVDADADAETSKDQSQPQPKTKAKAEAKMAGPRAVVTVYRYFDDITVFSTVDLSTGRVVDVQAAQHVPTPLSDPEFDEAAAVAREKLDEIKKLYEQYGDQLKVYPQFSQFTVKDDPRLHRVVHLNYRIGKHDLSYPRPQIDLTTGTLRVPSPEADPNPPRPRRGKDVGRK